MKRILTALAVLFAACATVFAQGAGYQVKAVVVDAVGPVIGASVIEQGTSNGVSTGIDGDFLLTVSNANAVVEISCIGYATQTFAAKNLPATVVLQEDTEFLDDVVVIGYGTVKKSDLTGSVSTVKADEINRGAINSPDQMLMGKVAGLMVTPASGSPGEGATIRIRGAASLNASNDPLIVIDGVPITGDGGTGMGNPLASVNPNDIESYSVLKDASATAIYGSRASNGVIIITTKKSSGGKLKVSLNASYSVKQNYQYFNMMNGDEFSSYVRANYPGAAAYLGYNGQIYNTDWQKEIYKLGSTADANLSIMGGQLIPFRISAGVNMDTATVQKGENDRWNLDVSLSPKFLDKHLSVNANAKFIYQYTDWPANPVGAALSFDPTKPVYMEDGRIWNWYDADGNPRTMASVNPLSGMYEYINTSTGLRSIGNLQLDYKIHGFEDLRFNLNLGYDITGSQGSNYNELGSRNALAASPDVAVDWKNNNRNTLLEAYLDYAHDWNWSNIDVMAGYSTQHNYIQDKNIQYYNREPRWEESDIYRDWLANKREYYLKSFFGRLNYSILGRYLITATFRTDASSRFSAKNRWGIFPSAALAWNIKNESFLKNVEAVDALKLRFGWGRTGQQDVGGNYYPYLARYTFSTNPYMTYNMGDDFYSTLAPQAYNPNLKWETTETLNLGLDFSFAKERVSGSVEGYYRTTTDLLNSVSTPLGTNFSNRVLANVGSIVNKGIEMNLNLVPVETRDWHWSIGGNVTFQDIKITKLLQAGDESNYNVHVGSTMGSNEGYSSVYKTGYAPFTYYLYRQVYDAQGQPVYNALYDESGDGEISEADRYLTGKSPNPWMFFGVNTNLKYKNWDFSLNGHGSIGNYALNKVRKGYATSYWLVDQSAKAYLNNLNKDFLYASWLGGTMDTAQEYSDLWLENASFFKIDDINLGYTFKQKNRWFNSLRVALSIQNVATFTKYSGLDPELTSLDGVDGNIIPRPRLYTIRLNVNF